MATRPALVRSDPGGRFSHDHWTNGTHEQQNEGGVSRTDPYDGKPLDGYAVHVAGFGSATKTVSRLRAITKPKIASGIVIAPMGASDCFMNDDSATASFVGLGDTSVMLWQPGSLALYADEFAEEFIELWGNEPTVDDAQQLATEYSAADTHAMERIIRQNARVWFIYTNLLGNVREEAAATGRDTGAPVREALG
jgi:hypothetical protein